MNTNKRENNTQIFTIGYGNRQLYNFIRLLKENKVGAVIDIRSRPYSRFRPEFNKKSLSASLREAGVKYGFKGDELGGKPKNRLLYTDQRLDYSKVRKTLNYQQGLNYLEKGIELGFNLVILCSELDYLNCHRYSLVGEDLCKKGYEVIHIDKYGKLVKHKRLK